MKLMPMGDYYLWYCEWCDSRNLTLWTRVTANRVCCAACNRTFSPLGESFLSAGTSGAEWILPLS